MPGDILSYSRRNADCFSYRHSAWLTADFLPAPPVVLVLVLWSIGGANQGKVGV